MTACLVTRGDCDMTAIVESLPYDEVIVWDNSSGPDLGIYGRYAAIAHARHDVIYTQDDDLLVTCHDDLLAEYEPGVVYCNYPEPWDIPWVARGALFDRQLPGIAFARYLAVHPMDQYFTHRACDGVFTLLSDRVKVIDHGSVDLPQAFEGERISTSPGWYDGDRPKIQERCAALLR